MAQELNVVQQRAITVMTRMMSDNFNNLDNAPILEAELERMLDHIKEHKGGLGKNGLFDPRGDPKSGPLGFAPDPSTNGDSTTAHASRSRVNIVLDRMVFMAKNDLMDASTFVKCLDNVLDPMEAYATKMSALMGTEFIDPRSNSNTSIGRNMTCVEGIDPINMHLSMHGKVNTIENTEMSM